MTRHPALPRCHWRTRRTSMSLSPPLPPRLVAPTPTSPRHSSLPTLPAASAAAAAGRVPGSRRHSSGRAGMPHSLLALLVVVDEYTSMSVRLVSRLVAQNKTALRACRKLAQVSATYHAASVVSSLVTRHTKQREQERGAQFEEHKWSRQLPTGFRVLVPGVSQSRTVEIKGQLFSARGSRAL